MEENLQGGAARLLLGVRCSAGACACMHQLARSPPGSGTAASCRRATRRVAPARRAADSGSEGQPSTDGPAAESEPLAAPGDTRELKKSPSEQFVQSHLMRASVLPPATSAAAAIAGRVPENGEAAAAAGGEPQGPGGGGDDSGGAARAEDDAGSEEGEEEHHAAGMGCTAASVLVRGDYVLVANTGARFLPGGWGLP